MYDRNIEVLDAVCSIEAASVAVGLFLVVFAGLDIDYGRCQLERAGSVRSIAKSLHFLCNGCKIGNGWQICC